MGIISKCTPEWAEVIYVKWRIRHLSNEKLLTSEQKNRSTIEYAQSLPPQLQYEYIVALETLEKLQRLYESEMMRRGLSRV